MPDLRTLISQTLDAPMMDPDVGCDEAADAVLDALYRAGWLRESDTVHLDPAVATALADLTDVDHIPVTERVDAILRHYLTDLHGRLAPAAASVAAVVTGAGLHRETLEGPLRMETSGDGAAPHDNLVRVDIIADATAFQQGLDRVRDVLDRVPSDEDLDALAAEVAEHAVEHRDAPATSGFPHLPEEPKTGSHDPCDIPANVIAPDVTPDPDFTCNRCGRDDFKSAAGLGAHRRWCTTVPPVEEPEAPAAGDDPLLDAPRVPVDLTLCVLCRRKVPSVVKVRDVGACCRDCTRDAT